MNPWQIWLQALAQHQTKSSQAFAQWQPQWQQLCQQWQVGAENAWASPASYWQAVSSIMSARARYVAESMQSNPQYLASLAQCVSFPEAVAILTRWQGHNLIQSINLGTITQAHRGNLLGQWQRQFPMSNPANFASMWNTMPWGNTKPNGGTVTPPNPVPTPKPSATQATSAPQPAPVQQTTTPQPTPVVQAPVSTYVQPLGTFIPAPRVTPQPAPVQPKPAPAIAAVVTNTTPMATSKTLETSTSITPLLPPQPVTESHDEPVTATGTHGIPIVSSTANSVMRNSTGNTIAAAAAARRSVVARRASGSRRRAPR